MEQLVRQQPAGETAALPTRNLRNGPLLEKEDLNPIFGPADHRPIRTTSGLSLDDLEAAQALEGLRAGTDPSPTANETVTYCLLHHQTVLTNPDATIRTVQMTLRSTLPSHPANHPSKLTTPSLCWHSLPPNIPYCQLPSMAHYPPIPLQNHSRPVSSMALSLWKDMLDPPSSVRCAPRASIQA